MSSAARAVAVMLDGPPTPAWQERALAGLDESPVLRVVEVSVTAGERRSPLRRAHAAIERHLFALGPDALAPAPLQRTIAERRGQASTPAELVIWLSELPPATDEYRDVLYLRHGGVREPAEQAFARAAVHNLACVETEVLLRHGEKTTLVDRTVSAARPFSTTLSRDRALWKFTALIRRAAERAPGLDLPASADRSVRPAPSTGELLVRSPARWLRVITTRLLFSRPWRIWVRELQRDPTQGWSQSRALVRWKDGHVYADPFLFEHEGSHHLFCEEIPKGSRRGVISHTELHRDGTVAEPPAPVLEAPYHLSYPFVFAHGGEIFLIPESSDVRRVELYRAVDFPRVWERETVLLDDLVASDATLLAHGEQLWLFVGVAVPHATLLDELHLFIAADPRGPWRAHPRNPIVSDVRCARPAGAIQRWGTRLVRPGQDGSRRYGGAISFREIDELSESDYAEHEIARLDPGDLVSARATHTYAGDGRFEAVDLRRRERAIGERVKQLANTLRRRSHRKRLPS
jgi:hypothetical protein